MNINIRPGIVEDSIFIEKLLKENLVFLLSPLRRYSKEEIDIFRENFCLSLEKRLKDKSLISFIAEEKSKEAIPLGFCLIEETCNPLTMEREIYINNIAVVKRVMGKMISNELMRRVEKYARDSSIYVITGDITVSNRRSMLFTTRYFHYISEKVDLLKFL